MTTKPRGRSGGRKSLWNHPTKLIRLPATFEAEILEYAHRLDSAKPVDFATESIKDLLQPQINAIVMGLKPGERRSALRLFKKLTDRLN